MTIYMLGRLDWVFSAGAETMVSCTFNTFIINITLFSLIAKTLAAESLNLIVVLRL